MSDNRENLDLSLGPLKLGLGSPRIAAALAKVLADSASPLSNTLGFIGDRIAIYREENVLKALARSYERLKAVGIVPSMPSPSFLIPYLEKVGVGYEDASMREAWENLFVSAAHGSSQEKIGFIDILAKLSRREAGLFDDIAVNPITNIGTISQLQDAASGRRHNSINRALTESSADVDWENLCAGVVLNGTTGGRVPQNVCLQSRLR